MASAQGSPSATVQINEPGSEAQLLAQRVGLWDVVETVWDHPGAQPVVTKGLVAERHQMGELLQEFLRPPGDETHQEIKRTDLLTFSRLEGRWGYVSFDTRVAVDLMPAWSNSRGDDGKIALTFAPFAIPSAGVPGASGRAPGQFLRMEQVITFDGPDHDVKDQYFTLADGNGVRWLAHRYAYTRRP